MLLVYRYRIKSLTGLLNSQARARKVSHDRDDDSAQNILFRSGLLNAC
jgi:hypothetical protein